MLNDVGDNIPQSDIYKIIGRKFILQIFSKSIANNYVVVIKIINFVQATFRNRNLFPN